MAGSRTPSWRRRWAPHASVYAALACFASLVVAAVADGDEEEDPSFWLYVSIPVVSALVGWGTNVVALKM